MSMGKVSPGSWIGITAVGLIALLISCGMYIAERQDNLNLKRELFDHSIETQHQLQLVLSSVQDAETGQRGYLLTGNDRYLEPYTTALVELDKRLARLRILVKDDRHESELLSALSSQIESKFAELKETIELRKNQGFDAAVRVVRSDRGMKYMLETRRLTSTIQNYESNVVINRERSFANAKGERNSAFLTLIALSIMAVLVLSIQLFRFLRRRQRTERWILLQYQVAQILNKSVSRADAVGKVLDELCKAQICCVARLWEFGASRKSLECVDVQTAPKILHDDSFKPGSFGSVVFRNDIAGLLCNDNELISASGSVIDTDENAARLARAIGPCTAVAIPIASDHGGPIGILEIFLEKSQSADRDLISTLRVIGGQLSEFLRRLKISQESEERRVQLEASFNSMFDGVCQVDATGRLLYLNPAAEKLLGYKTDDIIGVNMHDLVHNRTPDGTVISGQDCPLNTVLETRQPSNPSETAFICSDNRFVDVECSSSPVIVDGNLIGALVCFRDISMRKEAERRVSEFYSTVSHELRTPLTSIRGSLGLIEGKLAGELSEKAARLIAIARSQSDRLIRLINDILDLRKIEEGMLELRKTTVEARKLVERSIDGIDGMAQSAKVRLVARYNTEGPVVCDEDRTVQVLINLISNAIKFSPAGSDVVVSLEPGTGKALRFSVRDHGPGISQDQMHKLFGKFQQLENSDMKKRDGTGLGLAITKMLVEQHGGTIGVESEIGIGSMFWCELPVSFAPAFTSDLEDDVTITVRPVLRIEEDIVDEVLKEPQR